MKRLRNVLILLLFVGQAVAQQATDATKDPAAVAVVQKSLAALGSPAALLSYVDSIARGTLTVANSSLVNMPIVLKTKGTSATCVEVHKPNGVINTRIVRDGKGVLNTSDGRHRELLSTNTFAERVMHLPFVSLLTEYANPRFRVDYVGSEKAGDADADVVALSFVPLNPAHAQQVAATTRHVFYVEQATGKLVKLSYRRLAEQNPGSSQQVDIYFSDYRAVSDLLVPFRQDTYINGVPSSVLLLNSVTFNIGLADSEFALE